MSEVDVLQFNDKNYFEDCYLVHLETTDESLITEITQVEIFDEQIYIFDHKLSKVSIFSSDGKFLGTVGKRGNGPEEYVSISSFYVDTVEKTIHLIDPLKMAVNEYDLSGKFLKKTDHENRNLSFVKKAVPLSNNELFCYSASNWEDNSIYSIVSAIDYSTIQNIRCYPGKSGEKISYSYSNQPFALFEGKVVFGMLFSDTISAYKDGNAYPCLILNEGKETISQQLLSQKLEERNNSYSRLFSELTQAEYVTGFLNFFENKRYIICDFKAKNYSMKAILWDKQKQEGLYINNYLHQTPDFGLMKYGNEDFVVRVWESIDVENYKAKLPDDVHLKAQYPEPVINIIEEHNEEDNPILIFYKFKK